HLHESPAALRRGHLLPVSNGPRRNGHAPRHQHAAGRAESFVARALRGLLRGRGGDVLAVPHAPPEVSHHAAAVSERRSRDRLSGASRGSGIAPLGRPQIQLQPLRHMKKWIPLLITLLFAGYLGSKMRPPKGGEFAFAEFGHLPVMANGRYQPIDSLARNSLLQLRDKATALSSADPKVSESKRLISASQWLAEMMFQPDVADTRTVFRIDNLELKQTLELPVEPDETKRADGKHFSYAQIQPKFALLQQPAAQAAAVEAADRKSTRLNSRH